jgi:hypothetical protein
MTLTKLQNINLSPSASIHDDYNVSVKERHLRIPVHGKGDKII